MGVVVRAGATEEPSLCRLADRSVPRRGVGGLPGRLVGPSGLAGHPATVGGPRGGSRAGGPSPAHPADPSRPRVAIGVSGRGRIRLRPEVSRPRAVNSAGSMLASC